MVVDETDEYQTTDTEDTIDIQKDKESIINYINDLLFKKSEEEIKKILPDILEILKVNS